MKAPFIALLITLPLAGCFYSDKDTSKLYDLNTAVDSNYTVNEGSTYSNKIPRMKGELLLVDSDIKGVSIQALSDGWNISFKAPWVRENGGTMLQSESYTITLQQKVNEFEERKKTITFNVMDIKSVPEIKFDVDGVEPASVIVKAKNKSGTILDVHTRNEHGFMLPFSVLEKDADDISLGLTVSQEGSALAGARIEQVSSSDFKLVVPIDVRNPLKDTAIMLSVSDMDGSKSYVLSHRRLITPKIDIKIDGAIKVTTARSAVLSFDKNFSGDDYHFEVVYYDNDMRPTSSNVWIDHILDSKADTVTFATEAVPEKWSGIVEISVIRDGERGVYHYPITVQ